MVRSHLVPSILLLVASTIVPFAARAGGKCDNIPYPTCNMFTVLDREYVDTGTQILVTGSLACLDKHETVTVHVTARGNAEITCDGQPWGTVEITSGAYDYIGKDEIKHTCAQFAAETPEPIVPDVCPAGTTQEIVDVRFWYIRLYISQGEQEYELTCYYPEMSGSDDGPILTLDCEG
jgi:hypothetical protein